MLRATLMILDEIPSVDALKATIIVTSSHSGFPINWKVAQYVSPQRNDLKNTNTQLTMSLVLA